MAAETMSLIQVRPVSADRYHQNIKPPERGTNQAPVVCALAVMGGCLDVDKVCLDLLLLPAPLSTKSDLESFVLAILARRLARDGLFAVSY